MTKEQIAIDGLRAAQAAAGHAWASAWAAWVVGVGAVLINGVGLFFLYRTLKATASGVAIANHANVLASKATKQQLRAYVIATDAKAINVVKDGFPVFQVNIINVGQTPARRVRVYYALVFNNGGQEFEFNYAGPKVHPHYLAAGSNMQKTVQDKQIRLSSSMLDALKDHHWTYILVGIIKYEDIFGVTRRTTFRAYLDPSNLDAMGNGALSVDDRHNNFS